MFKWSLGVQESIIECVRERDHETVSPLLCDVARRPDAITRTCNDVPCPPRWNISDFSPCSKSCGGGVQTRAVQCIHEVARGGGNTLPVDAELCVQPPPRTKQFCNMIDCPLDWNVTPWSKVRPFSSSAHWEFDRRGSVEYLMSSWPIFGLAELTWMAVLLVHRPPLRRY